MSTFVSDVRHAVRRWIDRPLFATAVVLTLALGIGSTTAVFSVVDAVLLRPLPYPAAERLVTVMVARPEWRNDPVLAMSWNTGNLSWPIFRRLQANESFETFGVYTMPRVVVDGERTEIVQAMQVSSSFLGMLGAKPEAGRFFTAEEDEASTDAVLIGAASWRRRFSGASDIVGRRITLDSVPRTIVGIVPNTFEWRDGNEAEFFLPFGTVTAANRSEGNHFMRGVGRLKPGLTISQAEAATAALVAGPEPLSKKTSHVRTLADSLRADARQPLLLLLAAAAVLLLIAASNVAGLMVTDATARRHETAVRLALGATRGRLAAQFFAESLVLGLAASALGLVFSAWAIQTLLALAPSSLPGAAGAGVDARLLLFSMLLTIGTTVVFGGTPSLVGRQVTAARAVREGGWGSGRRWSRSQRTIVTVQVGMATVLLVTAALLAQTLFRLKAVPVGFDPGNLVIATLRYPSTPVVPPPERPARTEAVLTALAAVPGVEAVTAVSSAPFSGGSGSSSISIEGHTGERGPVAFRQVVTEAYFETLRIKLLKGRTFTTADAPGAFAAVVTAEFERRLLGGEGVGKRFTLNGNLHEVVGVVGDTKHREFTDEAGAMFYILHRQLPSWPVPTFIMRTGTDPDALSATVRQTLERHDPRSAVATVETMTRSMQRSVAEEQYRATLTVAFAGAAVLLAGVGLYGLIARSVMLRVREFGVRAALGATPGATLRLVLGDGVRLTAAGLALGLGAAALTGRLVESLLFGVRAWDPAAFIFSGTALAVVALVAAAVPAYRASRVDPIIALRDR